MYIHAGYAEDGTVEKLDRVLHINNTEKPFLHHAAEFQLLDQNGSFDSLISRDADHKSFRLLTSVTALL
jgi:hypothetical protein